MAFENQASSMHDPAEDAFAITPHDDNDLAQVTRGVYVGTGGDIAAITKAGTTITFVAVAGGAVLPLRASRILATGTTASNLVGMV